MIIASVTVSRSTAASPTVSNGRAVTPYPHTVGADFAIKAVESSLLSGGGIIRNGKRKGENIATSDIGKLIKGIILMDLSLCEVNEMCSISITHNNADSYSISNESIHRSEVCLWKYTCHMLQVLQTG